MAHELETLANGQTAFASARLSAWHQLGTVTDDCMTAEELMAKAWLGGWWVRKIPLEGVELTSTGVTRVACPDKMMTVRTNAYTRETEYLGIVGDSYGVVQNEQVAETLDLLADAAGGAHFETGGSMYGGKQVFVTMKLPSGMRIAGLDDLDLYLAATTSHDGTRSLRVDATPVRIVCQNTQRAAFAASKGTYTFRHTSNVHQQISQCREAIGIMWDFMTEFEQQAERMINEALTLREFETITAQLWPLAPDATEQTVKNAKQRNTSLRFLLRHADTNEAIRGTRYAGYQAVTEYVDHYAPAKDDATRAARAVSANAVDIKTRAFELLSV